MGEIVVLVTGATGGVGQAVTENLLHSGAHVIGVSRSVRSGGEAHSNLVSVAADLSSESGAGQAVDLALQRFGRIDGVVHTVGTFAMSAIHETSGEEWRRILDENLNSAFYLLRAALPPMRSLRYGRIVVIGSLAATAPHAGLSAYAASKTALHQLVQTAALENRDFNIAVNAILPGTIDTQANRRAMPGADPSQWLSPQKLARLCVQLVADPDGILTGALIPLEK